MTKKNNNKPDFIGMATVFGVRCLDGRVIEHGAFKHQDGTTIPLVYRHGSEDISNVLGHGVLEETPKGMKISGYFNKTESGAQAKAVVMHGDLKYLSIHAKKIRQTGAVVKSGHIIETSLVFWPSNDGASITQVLKHGDNPLDDLIEDPTSVYIESGEPIEITHEVDTTPEKETLASIMADFTDDQKDFMSVVLASTINHSAVDSMLVAESKKGGLNLEEVYKTFSEEQKLVINEIVGASLEITHEETEETEENEDNNTGEDNMSTTHIFENDGNTTAGPELIHEATNTLHEASMAWGSISQALFK